MRSQGDLRSFFATLALPALCAVLTLYFGYYALNGNHGLLSLVRVAHESEIRRSELAEIRANRLGLEQRVRLLGGDEVDPDLLDERARDTLGLTHPDDVVIMRAPARQ